MKHAWPVIIALFAIVSIVIATFFRNEDLPGAAEIRYLGNADASNGTPVLASSGKWVVAVWTSMQGSHTNVFASTSSDGGKHFGIPVQVNGPDAEAQVYGENPPRVAIGLSKQPNEIPHIVVSWPCGRSQKIRLRSARSTDGGRTFSASTSIGDPNIEGERGFQSMAEEPAGVLRAVWLDGRRDPGAPHHANEGNDWDPMHLMYSFTTPAGGWVPEKRLATNVCDCCKTATAISADGSVYVAFRNIYPGDLRDISLAVSRDGKTFSRPARVSEDHWSLKGCPDDGPTAAFDSNSVLHIVWPTMVTKPQPAIRFFHSSTKDGVKFAVRKEVPTLGSAKPAHAQMIRDACGMLHLVWDEMQGSTHRILLRKLTPLSGGNIQIGPMQVVSAEQPATYPVIAYSRGGLLVAWTENTKGSDRSAVAVRRIETNDCKK